MGELSRRREQTKHRLSELRDMLRAAEHYCMNTACVYATGSFGRVEASLHSDLDLFIVGKNKTGADGKVTSALSHLNEICLMAELIQTTRTAGIPEFSGDGEYVAHYSTRKLTTTLGTREDDVTNAFTARLLLLLESTWLVNEEVYGQAIDDVIAAYWKAYPRHQGDFVPAFLTNDILRLWRTFCVNYEVGAQQEPEERRAKWRLKNYKLRHSRLLTCYSALLYLLVTHKRKNTVSPRDVKQMCSMTPTGRIEWLLEQSDLATARHSLRSVLAQYEQFLETTNASEAKLIEQFKTPEMNRRCNESSSKLGDLMFGSLQLVGDGNTLYRMLVV